MKKILFLLMLCGVAYGQTRTTYLKLPQWTTGDTLKAGTANDTAQSNFSLNNAFARLESILKNAGLTSGADSGYFSHIRGAGGTDLIINPGYSSGTVRRLIVSDSLYTVYNATFDQNMLVAGNITLGGYVTADSIVSGGDLWINNDLGVAGNTTVYGLLSSIGTLSSDVGITANTDISAGETMTINENVGGYTATSGTQAKMYVKNNYFIIMFNDGGTYKYRYLDLASTNATWTYGTSEP